MSHAGGFSRRRRRASGAPGMPDCHVVDRDPRALAAALVGILGADRHPVWRERAAEYSRAFVTPEAALALRGHRRDAPTVGFRRTGGSSAGDRLSPRAPPRLWRAMSSRIPPSTHWPQRWRGSRWRWHWCCRFGWWSTARFSICRSSLGWWGSSRAQPHRSRATELRRSGSRCSSSRWSHGAPTAIAGA